ncbi:MAG: hypothetical protein J6C16_02785, partial [Clostridia bacterium]|nr:hypothetical protein [Clostridia bacterium]
MTVSAEGGASATTSPVTIGTAVDFSKDGVIVSSGNEHTVDGTSIKLGAVGTTPAGVEIVNPYASNAAIASETYVDALMNNGETFNAFVYRKPVNNVQGNESNTPATDVFYVAPYATVEEAQKAASESGGKIEIVESLEELTYATKQGNDVVNLMTNWDPSYPNIKIMNLAQITGASESSAAALNFIAPEWKTGVSVSMWVKATSDKSVPVFTFINSNKEEIGNYNDNNCGAIQFYTDGSFAYVPASKVDGSTRGAAVQNMYTYKFDSDSVPSKKVGKWVYVTVNIKNDGVEVYYNGNKSTTIKGVKKLNCEGYVGKGNHKYFNYGFGAYTQQNLSKILSDSAYTQILNTKSLTGENAIKLASLDKILSAGGKKEDYYSMLGYGRDSESPKGITILDYISKPSTQLYIGGDNGTAVWATGIQSADGANLEVKDIVFDDEPATAEDVENAFLTTEMKVAEEQPIESTNAAAMKAYDYTLDDMENAEGVNKLNEEHNEAAFATDEFNNSVIVLGAIADQAKGVELDNPFVGNKEIKETVAEALSATAISFNGWTVAHSEGDLKYNRVNDSATKTEAVDKFATNAKSSVEQYERRQLVKLAESVYVTGCSPELVGDSTTDYAVKFAEDGTTTDALTLIWSNMVADKNDKNGTGGSLANRNNFRKQLWNNNDKLQLSNEDFIKYTEGITAGAITLELAKNVLPDGKSFDEMYPAYASTADPANTTTSPYAFPYPTWKKGATVSTWVKVATDASATVLEFTDATATLNLT